MVVWNPDEIICYSNQSSFETCKAGHVKTHAEQMTIREAAKTAGFIFTKPGLCCKPHLLQTLAPGLTLPSQTFLSFSLKLLFVLWSAVTEPVKL